ncbi:MULTISPECIES: hypothetical protein [unclassified Methylobacterium]|uniref:beta strand repeat-containing protein n=1 Tax=unclassified Methylobacterium TaxID=2615210 RepID=UPI00226A0038|nr:MULTISPECIES: hypothetical protein [unclassified Methylobacterium]
MNTIVGIRPDQNNSALRSRSRARWLTALALSSTSLITLLDVSDARAQSSPLINVCAGLGVTLPHLQTASPVTSSFSLVNGLTGTLNGLVDGINQGVVAPLSDVTLRVGVLDTNGNLVSVASPGGCNLGASSLTLDTSKGLSLGGGRISGLGSLTGAAATAGDVSAIALGTGSQTAVGSTDAVALGSLASASGNSSIAIGLRGSVSNTDAVAIGTDASAVASAGLSLGARSTTTVAGAVALGSGAVADRAGLSGGQESFSGATVASSVGAVSVGAAGSERQITNVAGGTQPTDAVNLRQLSAVGGTLAAGIGGGARFDATTGIFTAPNFSIQGSSYNTVGGALGALDVRLTANGAAVATATTDLQQLQNQVAALPNLTQQDAITRTISVGKSTDGGLVSISGSAGDRRLTGVSAGTSANDAVNLGQLRSASSTVAASLGAGAGFNPTTGVYQGPNYTVAGTSYATVDRAIGALDTLSVQYVPGAAGAATNVVDFTKGGALGAVTLRGVAPGSLAVGSTEAVNGSQLYSTNQQLATTTANISVLQNAFSTSAIGMLAQDPVTRTITIGAATNGTLLNVGGTAGDRRVTGVATGTNANDAVNVSQLSAALTNVSGSAAALATNNQAGSALPSATGADAVAVGYGASATASRSVAIGSGSVATEADTFSVGAVGAERRVVNVANGTLASGSTDAVNGGQLYTTNQQVASVSSTLVGLRSSLDDGTIGLVQQQPSTRTLTIGTATNGTVLDVSGTAGNRQVTGVAAATTGSEAVNLDQLNAAVTGLGTQASNLPVAASNQATLGAPIASGHDAVAIGYGASATAARSIAIGSGSVADQTDTLSVGAAGAERRIVNVAAGAVSTGSTDAVNGGQLFSATTQVANALGGGARISGQTGAWTGPTYTIRGSNYSDVGSALSAVDAVLGRDGGQITAVTQQIATLQTGGGAPLVQQTSTGGAVNIANQVGGNVINMAGTDGARTISGVATGQVASDAVNLGQLNAAAQTLDAKLQDFPVRANNTRGAARPVASGTDAYASGYGAAAVGSASVAIGSSATAQGSNTTAIGYNSVAAGDRSTATGATSTASGTDSSAYGQGSQATASSATAIGAGSQAAYAGATAIGYGATAIADPTTAVGYKATASGNEASAFGAFASATAENATALGRSATARGTGATAVGVGAGAQGADSVAIGHGAQAAHDNAVALGAGVATTRANQVAIGASSQTYTLAGLTSAQSAAMQTGPTGFVTTDASGNLATSSFGPSSIDAISGRLGTLEGDVAGLQAATLQLQRDVRSAFQGTAIALALSGAVLPEGKAYAVSANFGTYRGQGAFGAAGIARISDNLYASGGVGFATNGPSNIGGRGGITVAW